MSGPNKQKRGDKVLSVAAHLIILVPPDSEK